MLSAGTTLGRYEIIAAIGAGGMGEVYRARDTKLGRDVAVKIVSDGFGHDPERLARFQREAHLLAALNHPHIAAIYGLEEASGSQFLVLELVEGETLAERLKAGPLPVSEALAIARQIADALQAAHEKGIIHRDLKPANIAFTPEGQVKVLDFGLAKALEPEPMADVSNSPTMTLGGTQPGVILGTAAYMAPEQAKGRAADKRSDVWAFGCVLYEMLTGKRAFEGEDLTDTIAAVMRGEPDWSALPNDVPAAIRIVLKRCLEKDRRQRIADISAAHFLLTEAASFAFVGASAVTARRMPQWKRVGIPAAAALIVAVVAGTGVWLATHSTVPLPRVSRTTIAAIGAAALAPNTTSRTLAITPDGSRVIYVGANATLFVRALDQLDAKPLTGLRTPTSPFVSPDGQWIGFASGGVSLQKVAINGGPPVTLTGLDGGLRGATWGADGAIVFATNSTTSGLQRIASDGEQPSVLTRPDHARGEADHLWPESLPGGQAVLFTITAIVGGIDQAHVAVLDLRTGTQTTLIRGGTDAHYLPSGHLVYGAAGTLRAIAFDLSRLAVVGTSVPIVPQVATTTNGFLDIAVAGDGTLVHAPDLASGVQRTLAWSDRQGQEMPIAAPLRGYRLPRISPDGTRVAIHINDQEGVILSLLDMVRGTLSRLTFDPGGATYPVWTRDSRRLIFNGNQAGVGASNIFMQAVDGTGAVTRLTESPNLQRPTSLSPDGTRLVFYENTPKTGSDLMQLRLDGTHQVTPLVQTMFTELNAEVSPDSRWLAYEANDSGSFEIYVRPFPDVDGGRWQVSTAGGVQPLWARNGQELFYLAPAGALMRVGVTPGATWAATLPAKLIEGRYFMGTAGSNGRSYDVAPDGRFLMIKEGYESASQPTSLVVVQHFDEELKRLVPAK